MKGICKDTLILDPSENIPTKIIKSNSDFFKNDISSKL